MNQRIQELADRAKGKVPAGLDVTQWIEVYNEELARLIVKECGGIYDKIDNGNSHLGTDDYLEAIHKHFGIE